jgi:hypothetical protein
VRACRPWTGEAASGALVEELDVLETNVVLLKWTYDYVSCDGAGCAALLRFLAARELRGRAYLQPTRSTDDDPAQASDNDDDD